MGLIEHVVDTHKVIYIICLLNLLAQPGIYPLVKRYIGGTHQSVSVGTSLIRISIDKTKTSLTYNSKHYINHLAEVGVPQTTPEYP